jgi:hypothetical protein
MARILQAPEDPEKNRRKLSTDPLELVLAIIGGLLFSARMALEHVLILGETGCGKSTGSFALFLTAYFSAGFGGLLNCVTESCLGRFKYLAELTGRSKSLLVVEPSRSPDERPKWRCNLVRYIAQKSVQLGHAHAANRIVEYFAKMAEARDRRERAKGAHAGDLFFTNAAQELVRNAAQVAIACGRPLSFRLLDDIIHSAPRNAASVHNPAWQQGSECYRVINGVDIVKLSGQNLVDFERAARYFLSHFPQLPPDTSGSVLASYSVNADVLLRGQNAEIFDSDTNFIPEMCFEGGALITLNMPPRRDGDAAGDLQAGFTYVWQMAAQARDMSGDPCPAVWASDEAHVLVNNGTSAFLSDCRNRRVACLLATQNISGFMAAVGGQNGRDQMESLLGNTGTKVFHTNGHHPTNEWASKMIAPKIRLRMNFHGNIIEKTGGAGGSEQIEPKVLESVFTELKKGGPVNGFVSESLVFRTGETFPITRDTYAFVNFRQLIPGLKRE